MTLDLFLMHHFYGYLIKVLYRCLIQLLILFGHPCVHLALLVLAYLLNSVRKRHVFIFNCAKFSTEVCSYYSDMLIHKHEVQTRSQYLSCNSVSRASFKGPRLVQL